VGTALFIISSAGNRELLKLGKESIDDKTSGPAI